MLRHNRIALQSASRTRRCNCSCNNKITRFHLPNRCFSHGRTRQEIWWEVRRRSSPLIAFRLIVREILLLRFVLNRNAYLATKSFPLLQFRINDPIFFENLRERNLAFIVLHLTYLSKIRTDSLRILINARYMNDNNQLCVRV